MPTHCGQLILVEGENIILGGIRAVVQQPRQAGQVGGILHRRYIAKHRITPGWVDHLRLRADLAESIFQVPGARSPHTKDGVGSGDIQDILHHVTTVLGDPNFPAGGGIAWQNKRSGVKGVMLAGDAIQGLFVHQLGSCHCREQEGGTETCRNLGGRTPIDRAGTAGIRLEILRLAHHSAQVNLVRPAVVHSIDRGELCSQLGPFALNIAVGLVHRLARLGTLE